MERVIFFGTGGHAEYLWEQITSIPFPQIQYIAFSDNDSSSWGRTIHGIRIIPPYELSEEIADFFVITSLYEAAIRRQLTEEIGIPGDKVYSFSEFKRKCYTEWQYFERYGGGTESGGEQGNFDLKKIIIYTSITGGYDDLHEPLFVDGGVTYVCFTDNRDIRSDVWQIEYIQDDGLDSMHLAKKVKLFPHLYIKGYETSVWVDGKLGIQGDLREYIHLYEKDKPMLCFPHYERSCIYEEAGTCLHYKKGDKETIIRQMSDYYRKGYPVDNGLYEMACIVRRHEDELVKKVMSDWDREIARYSHRDQVSFPVACYDNDFLPDICNLDIHKNKWLKVYTHNL